MERRKETFKLRGKHLISFILAISMLMSVLPLGVFAEEGTTDVLNENVISEMQNKKDINEHLFSYGGKVMTESKEKNNLPMLLSVNNTEIMCGEWYNISEDDEMTFVPEVSGNYILHFESSDGYIGLEIGTAGNWVGLNGYSVDEFVCHNLKAGEEYFIYAYSDAQFKIEYNSEPSEYSIDGRICYVESGFVNIEQDLGLDEYFWVRYGLSVDESINSNLKPGDEGNFVVNSDNLITSFDLTKTTEEIYCDETKQIAFNYDDVYYCFIPSENGTYSFDLSCDSWGYCNLLDSTGSNIGNFENYYTYHNMKNGEVYYLRLYGDGKAEIDVSLEDSGLKTFEISGTLRGIYDRQISETEFIKIYEISDDEYNTYCYSLDTDFDGTLSYGDTGTFTINENNCIVDANLTGGISEIKCGDTVSGTTEDNEFPAYCFTPEEDGTYKFDLTVNSEGNDELSFSLYPATESGMIGEILHIYVWDNGTISFNGYNLKAGQKYYVDTYSNGNNGVDYTLSLEQISSGMSEYSISGEYHARGNNTKVISSESEKARIEYYINGFSNNLQNIPKHDEKGTFTIDENGKIAEFEVLDSPYLIPGESKEFSYYSSFRFIPETSGTYTFSVTNVDGSVVERGYIYIEDDDYQKLISIENNSYSGNSGVELTCKNMIAGKTYYCSVGGTVWEGTYNFGVCFDGEGLSEYEVQAQLTRIEEDNNFGKLVSLTENIANNKYIIYYCYADDDMAKSLIIGEKGTFTVDKDRNIISFDVDDSDHIKLGNVYTFENNVDFHFKPSETGTYTFKVTNTDGSEVDSGCIDIDIGNSDMMTGYYYEPGIEITANNMKAGKLYTLNVSSQSLKDENNKFNIEVVCGKTGADEFVISAEVYKKWGYLALKEKINENKTIYYYCNVDNKLSKILLDGDICNFTVSKDNIIIGADIKSNSYGYLRAKTGEVCNIENYGTTVYFYPEESGTYTVNLSDDFEGTVAEGNENLRTNLNTFRCYGMKSDEYYTFSIYSNKPCTFEIAKTEESTKRDFVARIDSVGYQRVVATEKFENGKYITYTFYDVDDTIINKMDINDEGILSISNDNTVFGFEYNAGTTLKIKESTPIRPFDKENWDGQCSFVPEKSGTYLLRFNKEPGKIRTIRFSDAQGTIETSNIEACGLNEIPIRGLKIGEKLNFNFSVEDEENLELEIVYDNDSADNYELTGIVSYVSDYNCHLRCFNSNGYGYVEYKFNFCDDLIYKAEYRPSQLLEQGDEIIVAISGDEITVFETKDQRVVRINENETKSVSITKEEPEKTFLFIPKESGNYEFSTNTTATIKMAHNENNGYGYYSDITKAEICEKSGEATTLCYYNLIAGEKYYYTLSGNAEHTVTVKKTGIPSSYTLYGTINSFTPGWWSTYYGQPSSCTFETGNGAIYHYTISNDVSMEPGDVGIITVDENNTVTEFLIDSDTIMPVVDSLNILNYYPGNAIKIKATASDDFKLDGITLEISTDGGQSFTAVSNQQAQPKSKSLTAEFTIDTTVYADGEVIFKAVAYDKAENISEPKTINFVVDNTPPSAPQNFKLTPHYEDITLSWDAPADSDVWGYNIYKYITVQTDFAYYGYYKLIATQKSTSYKDADVDLQHPEEQCSYYITALDNRMNEGLATSTLYSTLLKDTIKPVVQNIQILNEYPGNEIKISSYATDDYDIDKLVLEISTDVGETFTAIDEKSILPNLLLQPVMLQGDIGSEKATSISNTFTVDTTKYAEGDVIFRTIAYDKAGNISEPKMVNFVVDNVGPSAPPNFSWKSDYEDITLSWDAVSDSDFEEYRIYKLINDSYECISAQTLTSYKDTNVDLEDPDKEYSYYITAVDKRQNEGLATSTLKASLAKDTVKPVVQNIQVLNEYPGNAIKISSNATDDYEISKLVLEISTNDGETFTAIDEKNIIPNLFSQPLMLLGNAGNDKITSISNTFTVDTTAYADGEVIFRAVAYDKAGNISEPKIASFIIDNTGPSAPQNIRFESGYEEIGLWWDVDSENDAKYYKVYRREGEAGEYIEIASQVGRNLIESGHKWTQYLGTESINVKENVDYYYYIVPVDYRENVGTASEAIKTSLKKDTVIPTVESINVINEYPGNAVKVKAIAKDDYKIDKIVLEVSTNDGIKYDFVSEKQIETSSANLTAEFEVDTTKYADGKIFFRALAYDKAGNISNPQAVSFTVDNTAPGVAENVTVSSAQEYNLVMWEKSVVEKDFMSFNIYRSENNNEFAKVSTQSTLGYYDTDTIPGKTYYYYITSVDNRRNESEPSKTVSIKRSEDTQKPEIVSYLPRTTAIQYKSIPIQISVYDNFKVSQVKIEYAKADSDNYQELTTLDVNAKSKVVSYNWDINSLEAGDYNVRFTAIDTAENNSEPTVVAYHTGTYTLPEKPVLSAQNAHRSVQLSWSYSGNNELISYYNVYRKKKDDANFVQIGKINTTSRTDSVALGDYVYKVEAVDKFGATAMGDEISASSVLMDSENPTAVISNQNVITAVNETVVFNGSYSHDNDVIKSYTWDFGDGTTGNGNNVEHIYFNGGNYTVTLTVEDASGNKGTAEIPVRIVDSNDDEYEIIKFTSKTSDGTILPYTNITVTNKETGEEINATTDNEGNATVIVTKGDYSVSAVKDDNELINQDIPSNDDNEEPKEPEVVELKLSRARHLKGEIKTKELTYDEVVEAGIDTKNSDNMHVYEYKAEFVYESNETDEPERTLSVTYYTNGIGRILGYPGGGIDGFPGWWSGHEGWGWGWNVDSTFRDNGYYIRPLGSNGDPNRKHQYFLVISGEVGFLKQMFKVDLILVNESDEDWVENGEATLDLPDGLSFASMTGGSQSAKQKINNDGKIDKNGQGLATWYVKGDVAGSYDLAVDVTGDYYPEPPENFTKRFVTQEPVVVRDAKNSLSLNISGVPQIVKHGDTVPVTLNVKNETEYDLYGVTMSIEGRAKSNKAYIDILKAGETTSVSVDITFDFSSSNRDDIIYTLIKSSFVCSDNIPTTVNFLDLPDDDSELDTDITFYEKYDETNKWQNEIKKLKYACGSFSWDKADAETLEEPEKTNFDELNMKVVITNNGTEGGTQNVATNLKAKIKAPDGFSFNETEMKTEYTISVDSLPVGESYEENVVIYPIYSEEYNTGDVLTFESTTSSDVHSANVERVQTVSVEKNENEGKIIIRDSFDSAGEHCWIYDLDMKLDGFSKPSTEYNHDLAKLSVALSGTVYKYEQSEVTLKNLGFSNIMRFNYNPENDQYVAPEDKDIVACEFATKKILVAGNIKTIVAVIIRGTVSQEWYSNFDVEWASAVHTGFNNAKEYVLKCFKDYMNEISVTPEQTKLLVTGHSRAAAAADLLAIDLDYALEGVYASFDDTYVYTFATPNSTKVPLECNNIFNIVNAKDAVTIVPADMSKPGEMLKVNRYILDFGKNVNLFKEEFNKIAPTVEYQTWWSGLFEDVIIPVLDNTVIDLGSDVLNTPLEQVDMMKLYHTIIIEIHLHSQNFYGSVLRWFTNNASPFLEITVKNLLEEQLGIYDLLVDPYAHSTGKTVGDFLGWLLMSMGSGKREVVNNWIYSNHAIETYIAWMNVVEDYYDYIRPVGSMRSVSVRCPVDVEVYNSSDKLVAKIVNNEVVFSEGVYCYVSGEEKEFLLDGNEYSFNITGNDDGKMDISSTDFNNNEKSRVINYYNIPVKKGETAVLKAGTLTAEVPSEYTLTLSDGSQQKPDEALWGEQLDNVEITVNIEGNGYAFGDGSYTSGEKVILYAVENESTFEGWYKGDELLSDEYTYSFTCKENEEITAKFAEKDSIFRLSNESTYSIDKEKGYLKGVSERTIAETVKSNFTNQNIVIKKPDGTVLQDNELVGTGTKIQIVKEDDVIDEITVVIKGDIDGDGKINVFDMVSMFNHIQGTQEQSGEYLEACRMDSEPKVNIFDLVALFNKIQE